MLAGWRGNSPRDNYDRGSSPRRGYNDRPYDRGGKRQPTGRGRRDYDSPPRGVGIGMMVEIEMIAMAIVMEMTGGSMINMMTIAGGDMGVVILQEEGGDLTTETEGGIGVIVTTVTYHQEIEKAREICQKVNCVSLMLYCGMYAHTCT